MSLHDSPFVDRLNTNYSPSDSEILEIRALLVDPENELARIDARIEEMEIALAQLKEQQLFSHRYDASLRMFLSKYSSCAFPQHNALIDPAEAPLVLVRSRHWRSVAYSSPILWRSIHIPSLHYRETPPNVLLRLEKIVKEWLELSANCSLSVSFVDSANYVPDLDSHPLVLQLLPFSRRFCHLTLTGDAAFLQPILRLGSEDLPLLQTLRTELRYSISDCFDAFRIPTLRDISLCVDAEPHSLPLPWSRLTSLRLACGYLRTDHGRNGGLDIGGAFDVLRRCPNLVDCQLKVNAIRENAKHDTSPIVLPHLQTLLLPIVYYRPFEKWGWRLVAPKLCFLQVGNHKVITTSLPHGQDMRATIDSQFFELSGLQELLQSFPMITHLQLMTSALEHDERWIGHLLDPLLSFFGPPHELCPILTNMVILRPNPVLSDATVLGHGWPWPHPYNTFGFNSLVKWSLISCLNFNLLFRMASKLT
ncbi:F-box domain-containing protein [Mycena sanguinolenta]|uniref:F-box domain-containing protein n=1 Tax=Mycena sanguinolenta TaxID=230812 RepID=A0A8H6ZCN8_9AGAR|nr:F-box domain-containing protein [Mycena sanguinolenta]